MVRKLWMTTLMSLGFALTALPAVAGYVYVQTGPPAPVQEVVPARPGAGYVWVGGYYAWSGGHYAWRRGYWAHHSGAWCAGHWHHDARRGYYWTDGRWC